MIIDSATAATPNANSQSGQHQDKLEEDLFNFLNLLVTQLQAQDPLDPMDANEFTSQLVQFANVEQQIYQNSHLETLVDLQQGNRSAAMVSYLGTFAEANGNTFALSDGRAEATYTLPENAAETTLVVKNALGQPVHASAGETGAGRHGFVWDGRDSDGNVLPDGAYTLQVAAQGVDGSELGVSQTVFGTVTGAANGSDDAILFMGDVQIPMKEVIAITEPRETARGRENAPSPSNS